MKKLFLLIALTISVITPGSSAMVKISSTGLTLLPKFGFILWLAVKEELWLLAITPKKIASTLMAFGIIYV